MTQILLLIMIETFYPTSAMTILWFSEFKLSVLAFLETSETRKK